MAEDIFRRLDDSYAVRLTEEMIGIPSVTGDEEGLTLYVKEKLESYGFKIELQYVEEKRPNLYGTLEGARQGKQLNYNAHSDTVPAGEGWATDPFRAVVKDGRIYGRGACDMKSGIACTLNAFRAIADGDHGFEGELSFSLVVDQEATDVGAWAMMREERWRSLDAIVLTYSYCGDETKPIPLGLTGKILYDIKVRGKAAHGFRPHLGVNAVEDAAKIVANLDRLQLQPHPEFGRGTYCTLKFEGGYQVYSVVIPASARFEVNRLLVPGETIQYALDDMRRLVDSLHLKSEVEIGVKPPRYEPYTCSKDEPIMKTLDSVYRDVMGRAPLYEYAYGITNANIFQGEQGIPCVHLGPQRGEAHGANEYVKLEWLHPVSKMYALMAARYLEPGNTCAH
ncbi:MAG: ArgE/DapE family deacylase [Candidatus Bathyarchaeia archaeon]|jgi:succinyl-diaminopimelate desuccinylase